MNKVKYQVVTRKIKVIPVVNSENPDEIKEEKNRVYNYIRNGQKCQAQMINQYLSGAYIFIRNYIDENEGTTWVDAIKHQDFKELKRKYSREQSSNKGSLLRYNEEDYPTGLPIAGNVSRAGDVLLQKSLRERLMYGNVSLPSVRDTIPLNVHNQFVNVMGKKYEKNGMYHTYKSDEQFFDALYKENTPSLMIKFANKIYFQIVFGSLHGKGNSLELRRTFEKIFRNEYEVCDSSIAVEDKDIYIYFCLRLPCKEMTLNEDVIVGVNLGLNIPAVCSLNNNPHDRKYIGSADDFLYKRKAIQRKKTSLQQSLSSSKGGHGRKRKLSALDRVQDEERNFVNSYNHYVSKEVINFALQARAKTINLEDLSGMNKDKKNLPLLRNWSYYQLQQMITYKANGYGIDVLYVNPAYMSQTCSCCGERCKILVDKTDKFGNVVKDKDGNIEQVEKDINRISAADFICHNKDCKRYNKRVNADFNTSRNVAMSTSYSDKNEKETTKREKADKKNERKTK